MKDNPVGRDANLPVQVARRISGQILDGRLKPGDRLPTEQELAGIFDVSRNVVREAIARLRAEGIVRSRQGAGVFVVEMRAQPSLRLDAEELQGRHEIQMLFELRGVLEIAAAGFAAERRTEEGLAGLTAAYRRLKKDGNSLDADIQFHRAVAAAGENNYVSVFVGFISEHVRETIKQARATLDPKVNAQIQIAEHGPIYEAIVAGRADKAREAMRAHLSNAAQRLGFEI